MDTSTATTAPESKSAKRALHVSPFGRSRPQVRRRPRENRSAREIGASPLRNARRDLSMFDPRPAASLSRQAAERLDPLVPPVISEPPRRRTLRVTAPAAVADLAAPSRLVAPTLGVTEAQDIDAGQRRSRVRLTARGRAAMLGLFVAGVALCSAITVDTGDGSPAVERAQVVARGGESVEAVATRAAQGRDVDAVAESIRAANGLTDGALPQAGDVLVVPGF